MRIHLATSQLDTKNAASTEATVTISVNENETGNIPGSIVNLRFEEGNGQVAIDSSGLGNDGVILGNPVYTTTTGNNSTYALDFDGTGDSIDLGQLDVSGSEMTLAAWFQATSFPGRAQDPRIISKASGTAADNHVFMLSTVKAGSGVRLRARLRIGGQTRTLRADAGSELSTGTWYHAAFTYDGNAMRLYLNGQLVGTRALSGSIDQDPDMGVAVGSQPGGGRHFNGLIDDVNILGTALDSAQVLSLMHGVGANGAPVALSDSYSTPEDLILLVDQSTGVLLNDTDPENDLLSASLVTGPANGSILLNSNGSFTYTPDADFSGDDTFAYQTSDGISVSNIATVVISVTAVNDQPVAVDDDFSTEFDTPLNGNVLENDLDVDDVSLIAIVESSTQNGTVDFLSDGSFIYTPEEGFSGQDSFLYKASDGTLESSQATVTLTVFPDLPVGPSISSAPNVSVDENQVAAVDVDSSGTDLSFALTGGVDAALFNIDAVSGLMTFKTAPDFELPTDSDADNTYVVEVSVTDSNDLSDTQSITINVLDVAEGPIIISEASVSVDENQIAAVDVDSSGTDLSFALTGGEDAALFNIDTGSGVVTFKVAPDFEQPADSDFDNTYTIQVTVTDSDNLSDTQIVSVNVQDVPEGLVITSASNVSVDENQQNAIDVKSNGTDVTYSLTGGIDLSLFDINSDTGAITFKETPDFEEPADSDANNIYQIEVTAQESNDPASIATQIIEITVLDVEEDQSLLVHLQLDDIQTPLVAIDSTVNRNDGTISGATYVPVSGDVSGYSLDFDGINDTVDLGTFGVIGTGLTVSAWINADTFPGSARDPRIVSKASGTGANDHVFMLGTIAVGSDTVLRARVRVAGNTTTLIASNVPLATGVWYHTAMVYDESSVTLYLDGAVIGSVPLSGQMDTGDGVNISVGSQPNGSKFWDGLIDKVQIADRAFEAGEIASLANGDPSAISIATADSYGVDFQTQLVTDAGSGVLANDTAGGDGILIATLVSDVTNGTLSLNDDGSFSYTPNGGFTGIDSFEYKANNSLPATVTLAVDLPLPPVSDGVYDSDQEVTYKGILD